MSKRIAVILDIRKRVVIGASDNDEGCFKVAHATDDESLVVTCEGLFSWALVKTASMEASLADQNTSRSSQEGLGAADGASSAPQTEG